jgi:hypothetical protein
MTSGEADAGPRVPTTLVRRIPSSFLVRILAATRVGNNLESPADIYILASAARAQHTENGAVET